MPKSFMYTGRVSKLTVEGKTYVSPEIYKKASAEERKEYAGTFDKPIPGMTEDIARSLLEHSNLHSFEVNGEDLEEKLTQPNTPVTTVVSETNSAIPSGGKK